MRDTFRRFAAALLLTAGVTLLLIVAATLADRFVFSRYALADFDRLQTAQTPRETKPSAALGDERVDFSLWSSERIRQYSSSHLSTPPLAVLRIDRLGIRVPVFNGTDDLVLNRGAGWIAGTAMPGEIGDNNIGIAGHRDGFFRGLKDIVVGDAVELATPKMVSLFAVDSVEIVKPENVGVLQPRGLPSLTLVTCYPFYFLGSAPQRFIVHAKLKRQSEVGKIQEHGSVFADRTIRST
jgi:sortase A